MATDDKKRIFYVKLRFKNQITLPENICKHLDITPNTYIKLIKKKNTVEMIPQLLTDKNKISKIQK